MTNSDLDFVPPPEPDRQLGSIMRTFRNELGQSLTDLTASSGVDESTLAQIEAGTFDPPWPMLEAIARGLDTSIAHVAGAVMAESSHSGSGQSGS